MIFSCNNGFVSGDGFVSRMLVENLVAYHDVLCFNRTYTAMRKIWNSTLSLLFLFVLPVHAQPETNPDDVASVDAIITALYASISGPAGQGRQWDRFRSLHVPEARLLPVRVQADSASLVVWDIESYINRVSDYFLQNGFFEVEIARTTESYGHILHAFSTYESYRNEEDTEPFARGINSIQLMHDGSRWWIVNIMWDAEREGQPIPAKYLPEG